MLCCVNASSNLHTNTLFPPHQISPEIRESAAKASRKLRYLNQALPSQTATLGSVSHVFNVGSVMKACDSFIKWQSPPRKLAKEVFVEFIPAKEKNSFAKEWRKVLAKDHVIRIESHEVFNTAQIDIVSILDRFQNAFHVCYVSWSTWISNIRKLV